METVKFGVTLTVEQIEGLRTRLMEQSDDPLKIKYSTFEELIKMAWELACKEADIPVQNVTVSITWVDEEKKNQE